MTNWVFFFLEKSGIIGNVTHCAVSSEQYPGNACQFAKRWQSFARRCSDNGRTRRRRLLIKSKRGIRKLKAVYLTLICCIQQNRTEHRGSPAPTSTLLWSDTCASHYYGYYSLCFGQRRKRRPKGRCRMFSGAEERQITLHVWAASSEAKERNKYAPNEQPRDH